MLASLIGFFALIGILVTVHEYGHLIAAKQCGVKVEAFSIGFGPVIWSRIGKDGVDYRISAIPLGGYVKMKDELIVEEGVGISVENTPKEADPDSFYSQTWWEKVYISFAGPLANLLFSIVTFTIIALLPRNVIPPIIAASTDSALTQGDTLVAINGRNMHYPRQHGEYLMYECLNEKPLTMAFSGQYIDKTLTVIPNADDCLTEFIDGIYRPLGIEWQTPNRISVLEGMPAAEAGVRTGDYIVAVNGVQTPSYLHIVDEIGKAQGQPLTLHLNNGNEEKTISVTPEEVGEGEEKRHIVGVTLMGESYKSPIGEALYDGVSRTVNTVRLTPLFIAKMVGRGEADKTIGGPIAIGKVAGSAVNAGIQAFLEVAAMLSISLAVLNLLPIPILDGGRIVQHTIEGLILHRPVRESTMMRLQQIGMIFILALTFFALYNDITSL